MCFKLPLLLSTCVCYFILTDSKLISKNIKIIFNLKIFKIIVYFQATWKFLYGLLVRVIHYCVLLPFSIIGSLRISVLWWTKWKTFLIFPLNESFILLEIFIHSTENQEGHFWMEVLVASLLTGHIFLRKCAFPSEPSGFARV